MSQPFVGQIVAVGFNFAPVGWALCAGQTMAISEYEVLYTLIGTTYGGNGTTTFNLPNLCGRGVVSMGQGAGLPTYVLGQAAGNEEVTLTTAQIGLHTHGLLGATTGTNSTPTTSTVLGTSPVDIYATSGPTTTLAPGSIGMAPGSALPHENRQPFLVINYIIALNGIFPSQS